MTELLDVLHTLGVWSVAHFWVPLLIWTLLALPTYAVLRWATVPAALRYRLQQALLAALPIGVGATAVVDVSGLQLWIASTPGAGGSGGLVVLPEYITTMGAGTASAATAWSLYHGLGLLTAGAALFAGVRTIQLVHSARALARLDARPLQSDRQVQSLADRLARSLGIQRPVEVRCSPETATPMTYGTRRPTILLPASLRDRDEALNLTLTHELVHIRRHDFLARWAEQFTAALFAIHPGVWVLTQSIERTREIACDAEALQVARCSPKTYANLLYDFSTPFTKRPAFALSIAETTSTLKERIQAMLNTQPSSSRLTRFTPSLAVGLVLILALSIVACSDSITPPEESTSAAVTQSETATDDGKDVYVQMSQRPELEGGLQALMNEVQYPEMAKEAGIQGRVLVQFVVNKNGQAQDVTVSKSVHETLDAEAIRAVKEMSFEPGMKDGEPINVQMVLPVTFKLSGSDESASSSILKKSGLQDYIDRVDVDKTGDTKRITITLKPDTPGDIKNQLRNALQPTLPQSTEIVFS